MYKIPKIIRQSRLTNADVNLPRERVVTGSP